MNTQLARSALWYARFGWEIFPLRPRTKEPFGGIGVYSATADSDQIMDWWRRWPHANIGLHCGGSGLLGLDLDAYKETFDGAGFLARADEETVTNLTGSGGTHLLYAMPENARYTNATGNLPAGIDVRGFGGYLVLPPSIHPNGKAYRWELGYGPHEVPVRPMPHALRSILDDAKAHQRIAGPPNKRAVAEAVEIVEAVLDTLDLPADGPQHYDVDGRRWILRECPFNPEENPHDRDRAAYVIIARDGHISAGCQHARCRERLRSEQCGGWKFLVKRAAQVYG